MKRILSLIFVLISITSYAQYPANGTKNQFKQAIALGSKDSTSFGANDSLILTIDRNGKLLWRGNGASATWKVVVDNTMGGGSVTSVGTNNGTGLTGGPITTSGTLSIDTTNISTRLFRIKGTDSLAGLIALKLPISDTANMLSNYQRILANYSTTYALSNDIKDSIQARIRVSDTTGMLLGYLRLTGGNLTGPLTTTVSGAGVIAGLFNANSSTSIPVKAVNSAANGNLFIGNNGTNDVFTVDGYGTIYGGGLDIGTNFSGVYSGSFGNSNVNGNGVAINAASGTNYALNIRNYNSSAELFKVLGNGNASASGTFTADSIKKLGGTSSQFLKADGSLDNNTYLTSADISGKLNISDTAAMLSGYNLQRVTNLGSTTTKNITANSFLLPASGNAITTNGSSMYIKAGNGNIYIGRDNVVKAEPDGKLSALSFIKTGGTSSQFLKADGSVDNNTYATTSNLATKLNISDTAAMLTYYLRNRTGLSDSYAIGNGSMLNATSGTRNIGLGSFSLQNNTDGGNNVAIGYEALKNGSSISNNTAIGYAAGSAAIPTDVENSVYLGYNSTPQAFSSVTNEIVIGASTTGNGSNTVTIGNSSITNNYFTGNVRGGAFIKSGGTSSQFLKADGSVDGTSYATAASLSGYVDLTTNQTVAGIKTFSSRIISTGGSLRVYTNGSNTQGAGANLMLSNAAETNFWFQQLNASNNIDWHYFNGSSYSNPMYLTTAGNFGVSGTIAAAGATLSGALSGTSLSMSGAGSFGGSTIGSATLTVRGNLSTVGRYYIWDATASTAPYIANSSNDITFYTNTDVNALQINSSGAATFSSLGTGTVYSNSGTLTNTDPSDSTIKNTINPHKYGLAEILKLQPKSFYYNSDSTKSNLKYGFIAQEVEKIMPDMVRKINPSDSTSKLGLESNGIYVTLVNAIKEQQAQIELLKAQLEALKPKQ